MRSTTVPAVVLAIGVLGGGWCFGADSVAAYKPVPGEVIDLPKAREKGEVSLEEALAKRRSVRSFKDVDVGMEKKGQLLWAAQGVTDERGFRTAPSAGATYPLEVYVVDRTGIYKYIPASHAIKMVKRGDLRKELSEACLRQSVVAEAGAVVVIAAVFERTTGKYGARAERYVYMEAGHAGQNLLLEAVALGLGAVPGGAFEDVRVKQRLGMPEEETAVYVIPVGVPR